MVLLFVLLWLVLLSRDFHGCYCSYFCGGVVLAPSIGFCFLALVIVNTFVSLVVLFLLL